MSSPTRATTMTPSNSLPTQLEQIGLHAIAAGMDDFLARAAKQRWSPLQILEYLAQAEASERAHRSLERRLRLSEIKKFKPMADFDWCWPTKIERDVIERALTLDFLPEGRHGGKWARPGEHLPRLPAGVGRQSPHAAGAGGGISGGRMERYRAAG